MKFSKIFAAPLTALAAAFTAAAAAILLISQSPGQTLYYLLTGPVLNPTAFARFVSEAARLSLAGMGIALAFRAGTFNLGGEGQALAGGLAVAGLALLFPGWPRVLALPAAVTAAMLTGALTGCVSGFLRARWNVSELISTFLIAAALIPAGGALLSGPMRDSGSYLIAAPPLSASWRFTPPFYLPVLLWSLVISAAAFLFLHRTRPGYAWRMCGADEQFAHYGGVRTGAVSAASLSVSGALCALAGAAALMEKGQAVQGFTAGLGWNGLTISLIAGHRPLAILPAAFAFAWLILGTQSAMIHTGFPFALGTLMQAVVFLFVTARQLRRPDA